MPSGTTALRQSQYRLPYHAHRHEPTNLLDQAPPLVIAAVARLVTAEISDEAGGSLRLRQRPSEAGGVCRPTAEDCSSRSG